MKCEMARKTNENKAGKIMGKGRAYLTGIILIMLAANLTACKDEGFAEVSETIEDAVDTAENAAYKAADEAGAQSEPQEEILPTPETYEDYMKLAVDSYDKQDWETALAYYQGAKEKDESRQEAYRGMSDTYLQLDDVIQALAILDEGREKCEIDQISQDVFSQRKEYILAGTVAVRTKLAVNEYDEEGAILSGRVSERDENGNEIMFAYYGEEGKVSYAVEYSYDENGNKIEYKGISYDSDGNGSLNKRWTWAYDTAGNEIEFVSYDSDGNIEVRTVSEYDAAGNEIRYEEYDNTGSCTENRVTDYDEHGNQIRRTWYDSSGRIKFWYEKEYDEHGNEIKYVYYKNAKTISFSYESEYDKNGNVIKTVHYKDTETLDSWTEYEYNENGNRIKVINYKDDGTVDFWTENEYDENGNMIKVMYYKDVETLDSWEEYKYDDNGDQVSAVSYAGDGSIENMHECRYSESGRKIYEKSYDDNGTAIDIEERQYDDNENITEYAHTVYDEDKETDGFRWERKYDADGRETDFYLYINEQTASYQSKTEYDENGRVINYTGRDKGGNVFVRRETEYDGSGKIIRESSYDAEGNLTRYYENEYDDFGSIIRQAMYEDGILKSEQQMSYVYRYIGNIDAEAVDYTDDDMTPEEYDLKQKEIFTCFLNGQETLHYRSKEDCIEDGEIVKDTITDLIDFAYCREFKEFPQYIFLDVTGDGIEELIISCGKNRLYVIQNDRGVLKLIFSTEEYVRAYPVKGNGRTGICVYFYGHMSEDKTYYFFDESGKKEIALDVYWDSEGERYYRAYDNNLFNWHAISEGEYYDLISGMSEITIDWQELEEPVG